MRKTRPPRAGAPEETPRRGLRKPLASPGEMRGGGESVDPKRTRTESSRRWLDRQLNDPYVRQAKSQGWRARAAFKLIELDDRFGFLRPGALVVDLGAAPGSWTQAALARGARKVVGVDLLPIDPLAGAVFVLGDFLDQAVAEAMRAALGGAPEIVLSDMAANTTGHRPTDQIKTGALAEAAAEFALRALAPGGAFVTKAFQGGLDAALLARLKRAFAEVRHAKPPASRQESPEVFVIAKGFRGE